MKSGFIGLGNMGGPMCRNVVARAAGGVYAFDPSPAAMQSAVQAGAEAVEHVGRLARGSDIIYLSLPTPRHVEDVVLGAGGLLERCKADALVIDTSTNSPTLARTLAARLSERGVHYIEAPVTGGVIRAADATLTVMVGCDQALMPRVADALAPICSQATRVGAVGAASSVKVINNMMFLCNLAAAAEGMVMASKAGVDLDLFKEIVRSGSGYSSGFRIVADKASVDDFKPGFSVDLARKDFELAVSMQSDLHVPGFVSGPVMALLRSAQNRTHGALDVGSILKVYQALSAG